MNNWLELIKVDEDQTDSHHESHMGFLTVSLKLLTIHNTSLAPRLLWYPTQSTALACNSCNQRYRSIHQTNTILALIGVRNYEINSHHESHQGFLRVPPKPPPVTTQSPAWPLSCDCTVCTVPRQVVASQPAADCCTPTPLRAMVQDGAEQRIK